MLNNVGNQELRALLGPGRLARTEPTCVVLQHRVLGYCFSFSNDTRLEEDDIWKAHSTTERPGIGRKPAIAELNYCCTVLLCSVLLRVVGIDHTSPELTRLNRA